MDDMKLRPLLIGAVELEGEERTNIRDREIAGTNPSTIHTLKMKLARKIQYMIKLNIVEEETYQQHVLFKSMERFGTISSLNIPYMDLNLDFEVSI